MVPMNQNVAILHHSCLMNELNDFWKVLFFIKFKILIDQIKID